jgi:hypothetical protein
MCVEKSPNGGKKIQQRKKQEQNPDRSRDNERGHNEKRKTFV